MTAAVLRTAGRRAAPAVEVSRPLTDRRARTPAVGGGRSSFSAGGRTRSTAAGPDEVGSSAAELVLVLPALMLVVTLVMQVVLWALASHAVQASAATAGDVARALGGTPAAAAGAARTELASVAGGLVESPSVDVTTLTGGVSVVVVSGTVPSLIPGLHLGVSATSAGYLGEFRGTG